VLPEEDLDWRPAGEKWKDLKSIILYRRKYVEGDKTTVSTYYYISSLALDAEEATRAITQTLVDREQFTLVSGRMLWGGRGQSAAEPRRGESEHLEKNSAISTAKKGTA
jgi:hypothetical protein